MKNRTYIAIVSMILAVLFTIYIALDTFVIPHVYEVIDTAGTYAVSTKTETETENASGLAIDDNEDYSGQTDTEAADNVETTTSEDSDSSGESSGSRRGRSSHRNSDGDYQSNSESADDAASSDDERETTAVNLSTAETTSESYSDENIKITLTTYRAYDTDIYVADITLTSSEYLKTAFAKSSFGKNVTDTTSSMASENNAILAINGDYYGVQESGYVIRNGKLYRNTKKGNQEDIVIYQDGSMEVINENDITAEELIEKGAVNVMSFGPGLVEKGEITVSTTDEVSKASYSNPRTAMGMIGERHYVFVVADGRTDRSEGLSLYQLASFMKTLGVETAYNLDGGGSSTMVFNNKVVNNPTSGGHGWGSNSSERSVSDIVYIGY